MNLKNLKLKYKMVTMIVIEALIFTVLCCISLFLLRSMDARHKSLMGDNGLAQGDIALVVDYIKGEEIALRDAVFSNDVDFSGKLKNEVSALEKDYDAMRTHFQIHIITKEEQELIDKIDNLRKVRNSEFNRIVNLSTQMEIKAALNAKYSKLADDFIDGWIEMLEHKKQSATVETDSMQKMINLITIVVILLIIGCIAFCVLFGGHVAGKIAKRINLCVDRIKLLAKGDLNTPSPKAISTDESGQLAVATETIVKDLNNIITDIGYLTESMADGNLNVGSKIPEAYIGDFSGIRASIRKMRDSLTHILGEVKTASNQIKEGAGQVANASQDLSQGATQQASSVEELSSILSEISSHIKKDAAAANDAAVQNTAVIEAVHQNNELMDKMSDAMQQISDRSSEISKIIKTINDIAFQTNILALNAAVEAARAGEAGKGFAVVADEVRNLAAKSAEAANNTEALIAESIAAVNNGVEIAQKTAESVNQIVESTKQVDILVRDIAKNTTSQSESISQINIGVDQISAVVQSNTATSEEQAAASEELSAQANYLENLLSKFDLSSSSSGKEKLEIKSNISHIESVKNEPMVREERVINKENFVQKPVLGEKSQKLEETSKFNDSTEEDLSKVKNSLEPMVYSPHSGVQTISTAAPKVITKPNNTIRHDFTLSMDNFEDMDPKY